MILIIMIFDWHNIILLPPTDTYIQQTHITHTKYSKIPILGCDLNVTTYQNEEKKNIK